MTNNSDGFDEVRCEEVYEDRPDAHLEAEYEGRTEGDDVSEYEGEPQRDEPWDGFRTDAEADADALASAGHGMDEDYGCYGDFGE